MVNDKSCIKIDAYEGDKMQNDKLCVQLTHTKKDANGMICQYTHIIKISHA